MTESPVSRSTLPFDCFIPMRLPIEQMGVLHTIEPDDEVSAGAIESMAVLL